MSSQLECSARAALCMRLAKREPDNGRLWVAEAEHWSRLSKEMTLDGEAGPAISFGIFASLWVRSAVSASAKVD
jgi:hypothetical protein